ncbi:hypothetical protein A3C96_04020 [Candidatus Uhrbacteria bacterium RIFCSPHIGHO2_02_FULL_60_10]|uniref:S1 motif domain-containing protein n=1 Tax=Candidatus Uhrbacteria bacterium RIFCSPHIGHO2_02_FULL_60_10 TaxID=1802392 RepID=A0A1F7U895_9BACT|nr:MAG: hypothetical protein A3C96_04020 [Candidatus Uhrbacteria bacterium RIFCSPHIGHO2_02_FULL_60_10]
MTEIEQLHRLETLKTEFRHQPCAKHIVAYLDRLEHKLAVVSGTAIEEVLVLSGIVQGGIVAAVADYAGVYAAMSIFPDGFTELIQISLQYVRPVKRGQRMTATAVVVSQTKRFVGVTVEVLGDDMKLRAFGMLTFATPKPTP